MNVNGDTGAARGEPRVVRPSPPEAGPSAGPYQLPHGQAQSNVRAVDRERARYALIGLALLAAGCAWAWPPLGLIVPGLYLLLIATPYRRR